MAERLGVKNSQGARYPRTEFRSSMTTPGGLGNTDIIMGRVVNVDYVNWTVDVYSQFDQQRILDVQVGSPYMHPNRGEGMYIMPEVGAKCSVCWPGDSSPPFVFAFVMPHEVSDTATEDAPAGTTAKSSLEQSSVTASFAGGRPAMKGGDMMWRGRDGNYVVLHRGGVLQIGSNELSQRLYIPLNNLIMDFCENYAMHNSGGSVVWGLRENEGTDVLPAEMNQTFRVYANDKYADVRVSAGKLRAPVPDSDTNITAAGVGVNEPVVFEFAFAKNGFKAEDGSLLTGTANALKLRFVFDRDGNAAFRIDGNVYLRCRKRLHIKVDEDIKVEGRGGDLSFSDDIRLQVGGTLEITAPVVRWNGGKKPAAFMGGTVAVTLPPNILMASPTPPGFAPLTPPFNTCTGVIVDGDPAHLIGGG